MTGLALQGVSVHYGEVLAVDAVDLDVAPGEVVALLGASGSGKSSLLRGVAGLEPLTAGEVRYDGQDLTRVPVHKRGFGLLFQDGQLFSHLNVERNVAYGLFRQPRGERRQRVAELLELVGLAGYGKRRVSELSGGQAQRVALARSLAPRPRLLLLDEPLSALDRNLREHLVGVLSEALRATGTAAIHVTHDQDEAFALADRVGVLADGRLLQIDTPETLWGRPASKGVAAFLGFSPFISGDLSVRLGGPTAPDGAVVGVGPVGLVPDADGTPLPVVEQRYQRGEVLVEVRLPDGQTATVQAPEKVPEGNLAVRLDPAGCVLI